MIRLNKFLAQSGVASRREADRMIAEGEVRVDGRVVRELGTKVDEDRSRVEVRGRPVVREERLVHLILYKPRGVLVTFRDPEGRPTIQRLLPKLRQRVFPVGRLDFNSEGLLFLTNDGELALRLAHPRYETKKKYIAEVEGLPASEALDRLEKGVMLDGRRTAPAKAKLLARGQKRSRLLVEVHEGRKHEVRRMCEAVGHPVRALKRIGFAGLTLGGLKPGQWRFLEAKEVGKLRAAAGLG
ncbi:MAG: rRNA pseudouridine synthase [Candidatus Aminicenantes bacterium]|nr:rRNA pseudouridine synthase [Candidatus Aminicenantes bacterium]